MRIRINLYIGEQLRRILYFIDQNRRLMCLKKQLRIILCKAAFIQIIQGNIFPIRTFHQLLQHGCFTNLTRTGHKHSRKFLCYLHYHCFQIS